ncbi:unnamed protein product [Ambrosiozyma monospora]|uniref:Unnamed protein product n=1 Tax=Ambrosiozyma monospora TaxID=43982 RepID=A0ACB5TYK4_AMBMO|nr:unnamed protein product [Ambrosiozyma monospora]
MANECYKLMPFEALAAKIVEDDMFQTDIPLKVNWLKLAPKLKKSRLHELEPHALELIYQIYRDFGR